MDSDDPRKALNRFTKVDEKGPYRDDGNISWPGGGGPTYEILHPITKMPCKVPSRGWVYTKKERMLEEIENGRVVFGEDHTTTPRIRTNLFEQTDQVLKSVHYSYAQKASQEFNALFDDQRVFDNPKNFKDLKTLVDYLTDVDDLILDFFAGSGSIGHAIYESNKLNSSKRKFLLVQLPEPISDKKNTGKTALSFGFEKISDISIGRLKRVIKNIEKDQEGKLAFSEHDLGFKVFRLQSSHMQNWDGTETDQPADLLSRMEGQTNDPLTPGWQPEAVAWEIALKEGFPLTSKIETKTPMGHTVYRITDRDDGRHIHICLEDELDEFSSEIPRMLGLTKEDLFICRDLALDDTAAANLALACRLKTI